MLWRYVDWTLVGRITLCIPHADMPARPGLEIHQQSFQESGNSGVGSISNFRCWHFKSRQDNLYPGLSYLIAYFWCRHFSCAQMERRSKRRWYMLRLLRPSRLLWAPPSFFRFRQVSRHLVYLSYLSVFRPLMSLRSLTLKLLILCWTSSAITRRNNVGFSEGIYGLKYV